MYSHSAGLFAFDVRMSPSLAHQKAADNQQVETDQMSCAHHSTFDFNDDLLFAAQ